MKLKLGKKRSVKNQFVLNIGDEGAVFCYFEGNKLLSKIFLESTVATDVKLMEKLMTTYPKTPITLLVDVIEQNYSQQVLPPVSSFGIRQQVQRRIKRDLQANDFNNVRFLNRAKEGRREWNFLFISLANSDPFAKWLELVLNQSNPFNGVYLLPLESTKLQLDLNKATPDLKTTEWELLVLHNKVGGFRIIAFKEGKLIFTRLAQNLVGDNIADIIVGNMEQEISNTVEYLKRMAFKGEAESKITIVAGAEVLQKVDTKSLKFGSVNLYTPFQIADKLNLPEGVTEKDKFADILSATHFASSKKHVLKFNSPYTKQLEKIYQGMKAASLAFILLTIGLLALAADEAYDITLNNDTIEANQNKQKGIEAKVLVLKNEKKKLPPDIDKQLDIKSIANALPPDKYAALRIINQLIPLFGPDARVRGIDCLITKIQVQDPKTNKKRGGGHFEINIEMVFMVQIKNLDIIDKTADIFLKTAISTLKQYKYEATYAELPKATQQSQFEQVASDADNQKIQQVPAKLKITGDF